MKERDYKADHKRRQLAKKRLIWEVDRQQYETLTPVQKKALSERARGAIKEYLEEMK